MWGTCGKVLVGGRVHGGIWGGDTFGRGSLGGYITWGCMPEEGARWEGELA